jgi:hypothetical protein
LGAGVSEFLDELARSLAKPMPRSRALRVLGMAVASAAVPLLRPGSAAARDQHALRPSCHTASCPHPWAPKLCKCNEKAIVGVGGETTECNWTCCREQQECDCNPGGIAGAGCKGTPCSKPCGSKCCENDEYCADPKRQLCCKNGKQPCGGKCCASSELCLDPERSLCCASGKVRCLALGKGATDARCCLPEPREYCAANADTAICCPGPSSLCNGRCCERPKRCLPGAKKGQEVCKCPTEGTECGDTCCGKDEVGLYKKCCPSKSHCCSQRETCCGAFCCGSGDVCGALEKPGGAKVCCQKSAWTGTVCCPAGKLAKKKRGGGVVCAEPRG